MFDEGKAEKREEFVAVVKSRLPEIQKALDESGISEELGACVDVGQEMEKEQSSVIRNWIEAVIAGIYEELVKAAGAGQGSSDLSMFAGIIGEILDATDPVSLYKKTGDEKSLEEIIKMADRYCQLFFEKDLKETLEQIRTTDISSPALLVEIKNNYDKIKADVEAKEDSIILNWIAAIIARGCKANPKECALDYVQNLLEKYYDKWKIPDGDGEHFPYVMNGTDDTKNRVTPSSDTWDDLNKDLLEVQADFFKHANMARYAEYENEICEIKQNGYEKVQKNYVPKAGGEIFFIKGTATGKEEYVTIKNIPVWLKKIKDNDTYEVTYDLEMSGGEASYYNGKGQPDMVYYVVKKRQDKLQIKDLPGIEKKQMLQYWGIGADCTGYVPHALMFIMTSLKVPAEMQFATMGHYTGRLRPNGSFLSGDINKKGDNGGFYAISEYTSTKSPKGNEAMKWRTGDIICRYDNATTGERKDASGNTVKDDLKNIQISFHIQIIGRVADEKIVYYESSSQKTSIKIKSNLNKALYLHDGVIRREASFDEFYDHLDKLNNEKKIKTNITVSNVLYDKVYFTRKILIGRPRFLKDDIKLNEYFINLIKS